MGAASQEFENWQRENRLGRFAVRDDTERGLEARYEVRKINDPAGKHEGCRYFVLDPQHDPIAARVLRVYADMALEAGYADLCDDIATWLRSLDSVLGEADFIRDADGSTAAAKHEHPAISDLQDPVNETWRFP